MERHALPMGRAESGQQATTCKCCAGLHPSTGRTPKTIARIISPFREPELGWSTLENIRISQSRHGIVYDQMDSIYVIPNNDKMIQIWFMVVAHTGASGHRGMESTSANLKRHFLWENMKQEITCFVRACLMCVQRVDGKITPCPLGITLHAKDLNQILHLDYLTMTLGAEGYNYILVLKDDASQFV